MYTSWRGGRVCPCQPFQGCLWIPIASTLVLLAQPSLLRKSPLLRWEWVVVIIVPPSPVYAGSWKRRGLHHDGGSRSNSSISPTPP
ncbi:hypothetical protein F5883DRAFT_17035 [Diaporthe sp. PMI_573]|nr:hypothetical protein F5883DRAFT_17035 [Diaporthaceae sp. PMI_573]